MFDEKLVYIAGNGRENELTAETIQTLTDYIKSYNIATLTESENDVFNIHQLDLVTHVVAEISEPNTGAGRIIEYTRVKKLFKKPLTKILCLYHVNKKSSVDPSIFDLHSDQYPNVSVEIYITLEGAKDLVKEFLGIK